MTYKFLRKVNKVGYLTPEKGSFSSLYLQVRKLEKRVLTDNQLRSLPKLAPGNSHFKEWQLRQKSTTRFIAYLEKKDKPLKILDLGCGNGWFTHKMAQIAEENVVLGLDINIPELEQAAKVFEKSNLQFGYGNIEELSSQFKNTFDLITINAAMQYFNNCTAILKLLKSFLTPSGEIHIIDSPFYEMSEISDAKERTLNYYSELGFPEMAKFYYHHNKKDVEEFEVLYSPKKSFINKLSRRKESPFPWLKYCHEKTN